ncbi:HlyD family secretion protein [Desulfosporosinus hippei]|uniref:HlyD family secretion protein n=1 Tax=Desulfosporosinus hippei DSM 8344 TaxID=1121419 RepID=A0A1G7V612_9FIRM|nr:HlyD family efflux transporter periplasmic adaptor subunit [Desulfosporosinus hippei]SDG55325.1 HlyD family secretion protein [Desulfosporosinus hippei DSM 8344]
MNLQYIKKVTRIIGLLTLATTLTGCASYFPVGVAIANQQQSATDFTGNAEAQEVSVNTKIPGRVVKLNVQEGLQVRAGDIVAQIDDSDLKAKEEAAQAAVKVAQGDIIKATAAMSATNSATTAAITKAQVGVEKAKTDAELALKTYQRMLDLHKAKVIADQDMDGVENKYKLSLVGVEAAEADLGMAQAARAQLDVYAADIQRAQASQAAAEGQLKEIENNLAEAQIKAPCDGTVTSLNVKEGEMVSQGLPLMSVTNYLDNWVNVKVSESVLTDLKLEQEAAILISSQEDKKLSGKIIDISRKPEFATTRATNDRGEKDIVSYNVKVQVNSPDLRPGMEVSVKFN